MVVGPDRGPKPRLTVLAKASSNLTDRPAKLSLGSEFGWSLQVKKRAQMGWLVMASDAMSCESREFGETQLY
jgi:hypothetical protein